MTNETRRIGRFEITAIEDADIPDEPIADAFPGIAAEHLMEAMATFPEISLEDGRWRLRIRAWLIREDARCVLVDTGLGGTRSPAQEWTSATGTLFETLEALGAAGEVETVVMSHAHDDHVGGALTDAGDPAWPSARYVIQRADVEWQRAIQGGTWGVLTTLEEAGVLHPIEGDHALSTGLSLRHLPGHTPGHQVVIVDDAGERMILTADTWNHPLQIPMPDGSSGSDEDPTNAAEARRTLLADVEAHPGTIVSPTHFAEPFGEIRRVDDAVRWSPI